MMTKTELVQAYLDGIITQPEFFVRLAMLAEREPVDSIVSALPPVLRRQFVEWAVDYARGEGFFVGGECSERFSSAALAALRVWTARHRGVSPKR